MLLPNLDPKVFVYNDGFGFKTICEVPKFLSHLPDEEAKKLMLQKRNKPSPVT